MYWYKIDINGANRHCIKSRNKSRAKRVIRTLISMLRLAQKSSLFTNNAGEIDMPVEKNEIGPLCYTRYKNQLRMG